MRKGGTEKSTINISAFLLGFIDVLAAWTEGLCYLLTFTLAIFRLLLVPMGNRFYFSQSIRGQWPNTPDKNFSRITARPTGVCMKRAWTNPYRFFLNYGFYASSCILRKCSFSKSSSLGVSSDRTNPNTCLNILSYSKCGNRCFNP